MYSLLWKQVLLQLCHGGCRGRQLGEGHDVLEGDIGLGAHVRDLGVGNWADWFGEWGAPQDLDHDGLLGCAEGLHCLVMGGLRQILPVDLHGERATCREGCLVSHE